MNTQNRLHINILERKRVFVTQLNRPDKPMPGKEKKTKKNAAKKTKTTAAAKQLQTAALTIFVKF